MGQLQLYGLTLGETERVKLQVQRLASQSASRSIHSCLRWQQNCGLPAAPCLVFDSRRFPALLNNSFETGVDTHTHQAAIGAQEV